MEKALKEMGDEFIRPELIVTWLFDHPEVAVCLVLFLKHVLTLYIFSLVVARLSLFQIPLFSLERRLKNWNKISIGCPMIEKIHDNVHCVICWNSVMKSPN